MRIDHIVHLDDLLRSDYLPARGFIYGSIAEPLRQAFQIDVPNPSRFPVDRGLSASFDLNRFVGLCATSWQGGYWEIPQAAENYLLSHIPAHALIVGYEMPPWLRRILDAAALPRIDLRISPLRFARDLVLAIDATTHGATTIDNWSRRVERQMRIDAGLMQASVRHNAGDSIRLENAERVIFVGQTERDASLIGESGHPVRIEDYPAQIRAFVNGRPLTYAAHPYAGAYGKHERRRLSELAGRRVLVEPGSLYELMAGVERIDFVSLSSGAIQEATYLGQRAEALSRPICTMSIDGSHGYRFATFSDVISPAYWLSCTNGESYAGPELLIPENLMRRLHNIWWGYSDYYIDNDAFWRKVVTRGIKNAAKRIFQR